MYTADAPPVASIEPMNNIGAAHGTVDRVDAHVEVHDFVGFIYFIFVSGLSRYGAFLERRTRVGQD